MHVKYHIAVGVGLYFATGEVMALAGSLLPDAPLVVNETKLAKYGEKFDPKKVDPKLVWSYRLFHSSFFVLLLFGYDFWFAMGWALHIFCDIFTHTGIFSWRPFHPFSKFKIEGKEILK